MKKLIFLAIITLAYCSCEETGIAAEIEQVGTIQLFDHFSRSSLGTTWEGNANGQYSINEGELEITCTSDDFIAAAKPYISEDYADITLEVNTKWISGIENNGYGIMFRDTGAGNEQYRFGINKQGSYFLALGTTMLVDWTASTFINQAGWNELKVQCVGSDIECYINDTEVVNISNSALISGEIYLFVANRQTVHFDDYTCLYWLRVDIGA
jgi:hypothetical protein